MTETDDKNCPVDMQCPVCNPPKRDDKDLIRDMRERFKEGRTHALDHALMHRSIREIEKLRAYVRTLNGQLAHIAGISSGTVENLKRNLKSDGGWNLD